MMRCNPKWVTKGFRCFPNYYKSSAPILTSPTAFPRFCLENSQCDLLQRFYPNIKRRINHQGDCQTQDDLTLLYFFLSILNSTNQRVRHIRREYGHINNGRVVGNTDPSVSWFVLPVVEPDDGRQRPHDNPKRDYVGLFIQPGFHRPVG